MKKNERARTAARGMIHGWYAGVLDRIRVPDYGGVQWAADGRAYVEALIEVPAEMLREEGKDD